MTTATEGGPVSMTGYARRLLSIVVVVVLVAAIPAAATEPDGDASPAGDLAAAYDTIVDESARGFTPRGYGWREAAYGYARHHYWARTARRATLTGIWRATLEPGRYRVLAWLPRKHATTRKAVYKVKTADGWVKRVRNQYQNRGRWVSLGTHRLARLAEVRLQNKTQEPRGSRRTLVFDALRFVPLAMPSSITDHGDLRLVEISTTADTYGHITLIITSRDSADRIGSALSG